MLSLKDKIIEMHKAGKSYNEIIAKLGCSKSTISYHCNDKIVHNKKQQIKRKNYTVTLKKAYGGKCQICGYDRYLGALDFHHCKGEKLGNVTTMIDKIGITAATKEAAKCVLLCANCHRELHGGIIKLVGVVEIEST